MIPETGAPGQSLRFLILGGSGGIGRAVANAVASRDCHLIVHGRDQAKLDAVCDQLRQQDGSRATLTSLCLDLDDTSLLPLLLPQVEACDCLAICRGSFVHKRLAQTSPADWQSTVYSNLTLPGILAAAAAAAMAGRGFGRILLFGGTRTDAIRGYRHNAAYAAAKTGLAVVVKSIAAEYASHGVSACLICPGFVDTEYLPADLRQRLIALSPRQRLIPPPRIARLALTLLDGLMDTANGAVINADEGLYSI